jgi:hypothetical protein
MRTPKRFGCIFPGALCNYCMGLASAAWANYALTSWATWMPMVELREIIYLAIDQDPKVLRGVVCGDFLLGIDGEFTVHSGVGVKAVAEAGAEY